MKVDFIGYSVTSGDETVLDQRIMLYDSDLVSAEQAMEMIEDPLKRSKFPNSYFDLSVSKLPFIISSLEVLIEIYGSITKRGEEQEEVYTDPKYLS
jgi:hypothetical protein